MRDITDGHVHLRDEQGERALFASRDAAGISRLAIMAIQDPASGSGVPEALGAKARRPDDVFVFAGLNHARRLYGEASGAPGLAEQVAAFIRAGCDGIKMIEGKPTARRGMDVALTDPYYADYWACVEEAGLPVVWHINDPEEFWEPDKLPAWARDRGWGYGPEDVKKEQVYAEVDTVLERHPGLRAILAHFYFLSADLSRAGRFLDEHPGVCFDLAPGIEMLYNISRDPEAGHAFFTRHADRIVFGTDLMSEHTVEEGRIRAGIVFRWLETDDTFRVPPEADFLLGPPEDGIVRGMALPEDVLRRIYGANFARMAGPSPRPLRPGAVNELCDGLAAVARRVSSVGRQG